MLPMKGLGLLGVPVIKEGKEEIIVNFSTDILEGDTNKVIIEILKHLSLELVRTDEYVEKYLTPISTTYKIKEKK